MAYESPQRLKMYEELQARGFSHLRGNIWKFDTLLLGAFELQMILSEVNTHAIAFQMASAAGCRAFSYTDDNRLDPWDDTGPLPPNVSTEIVKVLETITPWICRTTAVDFAI